MMSALTLEPQQAATQGVETPAYYLSKHTYLGFTADYVIVLDARRDEYSALHKQETGPLASSVHGWPCEDGRVPQEQHASHKSSEFMDQLVKQRVLTRSSFEGKSAKPLTIEIANTALPQLVDDTPAVTARMIKDYLAAYSRAAVSLKLRTLQRTFEHLRERKQRISQTQAGSAEDLARHVAGCSRLRQRLHLPLLGALHWSLTLIEYLARNEINATWVFGVRMPPFGAYCWLQVGQIALEENLENIRGYVPIAAT